MQGNEGCRMPVTPACRAPSQRAMRPQCTACDLEQTDLVGGDDQRGGHPGGHLLDGPQQGEGALQRECRGVGVVRRQRRVEEVVLVTGVEEELSARG